MNQEFEDSGMPLNTATEATPLQDEDVFWDFKDLFTVLAMSFASFMFLVLLSRFALYLAPGIRNHAAIVGLIVQTLLYFMIFLVFRMTFATRYRKPVFSSLGWRPANMSLWLAAAIGIVLPFLVSGLGQALHAPKVTTPIDQFASNPVLLVLFAIFAVTLGPAFEEFLFRGFIQPLLSKTFGVIAGVVFSAAIFGALHGPEYQNAWQYMLILTLAGAVFGALRARTNSIIPSLLAHGSFNLVMFIAFIFQRTHPEL